ncbi:MAG: DUF4389 domain-containing protein [Acidimicrobiales bacterium]
MPEAYPVNIGVTSPEQVARWRPLVNWLLIIPHYLWLMILGLGALVLVVLSWFTIVFTGKQNEAWGSFIVGVLRYQWRVLAYLYAWTEEYPSFSLPKGYGDDGSHPAVLSSVPDASRNRVTVFFRGIMVIPQYLVIYFMGIAAGAVALVAWFAVLFTGKWPEGMRRFCIGYYRWYVRVEAYYLLVTDVYPPFALETA